MEKGLIDFDSTLEKNAVLALQELSQSEISPDSPVKGANPLRADVSPWAKKAHVVVHPSKPSKSKSKHDRKTSEHLLSRVAEPLAGHQRHPHALHQGNH